MNKGELVDEISKKAEVTKKQADAVLSAALEAIMEAVASGDKVTLVGFGSFEARERKAREGRIGNISFYCWSWRPVVSGTVLC